MIKTDIKKEDDDLVTKSEGYLNPTFQMHCPIQESALTCQQLVHTDEKSYNCSEWSYSAIQKRALVRHQLIHTAEKPYKFSECSNKPKNSFNFTSADSYWRKTV